MWALPSVFALGTLESASDIYWVFVASLWHNNYMYGFPAAYQELTVSPLQRKKKLTSRRSYWNKKTSSGLASVSVTGERKSCLKSCSRSPCRSEVWFRWSFSKGNHLRDSKIHCLSEAVLRLPCVTAGTGTGVNIGGKRGKWFQISVFSVLMLKRVIQQLDPQPVLFLSVCLMKKALSSFMYACPFLLLSVSIPTCSKYQDWSYQRMWSCEPSAPLCRG